MEVSTALTHAIPHVLAHALRYQKLRVLRPTIISLGETYFLLAERLAVRRASVMLVRSTVANVTVDDNKRRRILRLAEGINRLRQSPPIIDVADVMHVPAVGKEPRRDILAERQVSVAFDRD